MFNDLILFNDIETKLIKVSEQIHEKNLKLFLTTNLSLENNFKNTQVFYTFMDSSNEYFLCKYENKKIKATIFDKISQYLSKNKQEKYSLVFFDEYFLIYNYSKLYYFQKIDSKLIKDDVIDYVQRRFLINIEKCHIVENDMLDFKKEYKSNLKYYSNKSPYKNYYIFILIFSSLLLMFYIYIDYEVKINNENRVKTKVNKEIKNYKVIKDGIDKEIVELITKLDENKIKLKNIDYKNTKLYFKLFSKSKEDSIYSFFDKSNDFKLDSISKVDDGYDINIFINIQNKIDTNSDDFKLENNQRKGIHLVKFIDDLEKYLINKKVHILNLKLKNDNIDFQITSSLDESLNLLKYFQNYSGYLQIKSYSVYYENSLNKIVSKATISKNSTYKVYMNSKSKYVSDKVMYYDYKSVKNDETNSTQLILKAIVDDRVLINDTWYKKNDYINKQQIVLVSNNSIKIRDKEKFYILKVHGNEYIK